MSSDFFNYIDTTFSVLGAAGFADVFQTASKALAAIFNTFLEFTGQQAVPNVLGK
ncbi:hypothetical protein NQ015_05700 [Corynebacterium sp. 153RC1]|uniref:hypothetical protein n=1 Tax=unclassified Corynebacterium TaxID=2624378 RepID=UPI00211C4E0C|nr:MULTISPECIES: hypothetical protein [unclassified Corynebacterium]MCQ9352500.1 hypothetical protein [Corynebacterium sp. 209RC1]MCQ9354684.1 hypothetical protein [Corynebacterium sp. 1222RC1]MCQ9356795.1 hypothetical protein [Corynebacterium sp. 122RC1]MCQ9359001.1 hypothetical protein [Corynebacterium sp. 142RC1]MCQ9361263.1 hypothetical protein [Corynebacterium sp. 153RC1]